MSIHVFTGTPGSGKSLHAASLVREQLCRRYPRPVIANFPLAHAAPVTDEQRRLYHYVSNADMCADRIVTIAEDYWRDGNDFVEDKILLCIDEAQLLFNSRLWSSRDRMAYLEFLSQSRKVGVKVLLIAQATKMIDNQFRMLIEVEHNHRRISSMGPVGWLLSAPLGGRAFMVVRYLYQCNERLGMDLFRGSKKDMAMYDSWARFDRQD